MDKPRTHVHFDGVCPFLMCTETDPHDHPVCQVHDTLYTTPAGPCGMCELEKMRTAYVDKQ